jgi:translocation and assembly module TamA
MRVYLSIFLLFIFPVLISGKPSNECISFLLSNSTLSECKSKNKSIDCLQLKRFSKPVQVRNLFDSLGFFNQQWDTLSNSVRICPGPRSLMVLESISGFPADSIKGLLPMDLPALYDAGKINQRAAHIIDCMARTGYPFATVAVELISSEMRDSISVKFTIEADQKYRFSSPELIGKYSTSKKLLLNDITIREGEVFDMEMVKESQRRLRSRSYIADVIPGPPAVLTNPGQPVDTAQRVSVPMEIVDRSGLGLDGAIGVESTEGKPRIQGNLLFSFLNLFHTGESVQFEYAGDKTQQRLQFHLSKPWIFNLPLTVSAGGGMEVIQKQYGYVFAKLRLVGEAGPMWRAGIGFNINETTPSQDTIGDYGTFYGADLILYRIPEENRAGQFSSEILIETGSGMAKKSKRYTRSHFDFSGGIHLPLFRNQAVVTRLVSKHIITTEKELVPAEMYRVGGANSIRGYAENEFPFRTVVYGQLEYLLYFIKTGSVFIFTDGGAGFKQEVGLRYDHSFLLGYGLGVRLPSKLGSMEIGWARNYREKRGMGRIHFRIKNTLAEVAGKIQSGF